MHETECLGQGAGDFVQNRLADKQSKYPTLKKKGRHDSARFDNGPETIKFKGKSIRMPVVGWVKMREELRFSGKRYQQQLKFVVKLNAHIANVRENWTHQTTTRIVREYSLMGIEDLNVRGMMANEKLARPISDVGFHEIRRQIEYKASIYNAKVVVVDRWYPSSKICSSCNYKLDELLLSERSWTCPACGTHHDRDNNAA